MALLETHNLKKHFGGVHAVDGVSLKFEEGKITGLIGPNGSGKTTVMNLLSGFIPFDSGTVSVLGESLAKVAPWDMPELGITRTFQNVRVFEQMTVLDNLLVVMTNRHPVGSIFEKHTVAHTTEAEAVLEKLGLTHQKNNLAANLSYGQRKLLEIGRALLMKSDVYLFDEPYAGLFPEMVKLVTTIMSELRDAGKTVILIEHNMSIIRQLCDTVIVMDAGKLLAEGAPEKVLSDKAVIEAYLGE
jgi:ABC-type branched-subunit amino acid transport system ATPase component